MSDRLDDTAMFEATVPAALAPLLADLRALEAIVYDAAATEDDKRARGRDLRPRLLAQAGALAEATPARLRAQSPEHALWFTEAVLLWTHYADAGGGVLVDSLKSGTLARFHPDLTAGPAERAAVQAALARAFGWGADELGAIASGVESRISNLRVKNAIARRLARELDGGPDGAALPQQMHRLFQRLFGPLPVQVGDVDLTLTTTTLLFGLPYHGTALVRPGYAERPADERARITAFLQLVEKAKNSFDSLRFPGFGYYDRRAVDPALLAALTAAVAAEPGFEHANERVVAETLATMVSLVPSQEADLFLIHDIWGHGWEESLCEFEWSYTRLVELRESIGPGTGPRFGGEGAPALVQAFTVADGRVALDRAALERAVEADLRGRFTIALNVVVAECLADIVEHKYARRRRAEDPPLPSSSLYPEAPLKLDLSLRDTQTLLKAAHRSYRRLLAEPAEAERLSAALAGAGLPAAGLAEAVGAAVAAIGERFAPMFATDMAVVEPTGADAVKVNAAQRVMLSMVALAAEVGSFLDDADRAQAAGGGAARASIDLLVLVLGWFYEQDRRLHFWHLDELLRSELRPTFERFARALDEQGGR